jgi:peptidyl-tRNA hydrolase, PTH1 family
LGLFDRLRARPVAGDRWLVVGLGNPEGEYGGTRHNVGAHIVRRLADKLGAALRPHKAQALVADAFDQPGGTPLSLVVPFGYMNNCGGPVQQAMAFYKVPHDRLVVVHDDLDLEPATLRLKRGGGDAGHNGLKDIRRRTGSGDYHRVRVGIGRPPGRQDPADYVLQRFSARERDEVDVTVERACDAILELIEGGLEQAQNRYHQPLG